MTNRSGLAFFAAMEHYPFIRDVGRLILENWGHSHFPSSPSEWHTNVGDSLPNTLEATVRPVVAKNSVEKAESPFYWIPTNFPRIDGALFTDGQCVPSTQLLLNTISPHKLVYELWQLPINRPRC
jgi:hypothetical protein